MPNVANHDEKVDRNRDGSDGRQVNCGRCVVKSQKGVEGS